MEEQEAMNRAVTLSGELVDLQRRYCSLRRACRLIALGVVFIFPVVVAWVISLQDQLSMAQVGLEARDNIAEQWERRYENEFEKKLELLAAFESLQQQVNGAGSAAEVAEELRERDAWFQSMYRQQCFGRLKLLDGIAPVESVDRYRSRAIKATNTQELRGLITEIGEAIDKGIVKSPGFSHLSPERREEVVKEMEVIIPLTDDPPSEQPEPDQPDPQ